MPCSTLAEWKDFWQIAAWVIAVAGGSIAAWKAISEMRLGRLQREKDLAWAQAREAFQLLDRMSADSQLRTAAQLLDYSSGVYSLSDGVDVKITRAEVLRALRTTNLNFSEKEHFVRDRFDALFTFMDRVEMAIEVGIVKADHAAPVLDYYAAIMARQPVPYVEFARQYGYGRALRLVRRLPGIRIKLSLQ